MDDTVLKHQALGLWLQGQKHHLRRDLERAIELYTESLELYPTAEAYTFRGWAYSFQGRVGEAIEECKKAIAVDPTFGNPYNDIGSYLVKMGELDEAIEWLEKAKTAPRYEPRHFPIYEPWAHLCAEVDGGSRDPGVRGGTQDPSRRADLSSRARTTKRISQLMSAAYSPECLARRRHINCVRKSAADSLRPNPATP